MRLGVEDEFVTTFCEMEVVAGDERGQDGLDHEALGGRVTLHLPGPAGRGLRTQTKEIDWTNRSAWDILQLGG